MLQQNGGHSGHNAASTGQQNKPIWMVAEEYNEIMSSRKVQQIAALIKSIDPYHPVAVHSTHGVNRYPFKADRNLDVYLVQYNDAGASELKEVMTRAVSEAKGRYAVLLFENTEPGMDVMGYGDTLKRKMQVCADVGAHVMAYDRGKFRFKQRDLRNMRALQIKMEQKLNG